MMAEGSVSYSFKQSKWTKLKKHVTEGDIVLRKDETAFKVAINYS